MEENKKNKIPNVPNLRFNSFFAEYERTTLNGFLKTNKVRNKEEKFSKSDVLSVSGELGVINQIEHLGRSYAGESVALYHILRTGQIVYTKSPLAESPYGIIKLNRNEDGIVSTLYAVYDVLNKADCRYIEHYFAYKPRLNNYLRPIVRIGAKHDMKIGNDEVLKNYVNFPSKEEQQKISDFLDLINQRIDTQNKIIEENKTLKNQLIDTLIYGRSDATYITLSDYCSLKNGYPFKSCCYVESGKYSIITIGNVQGNRFLNMGGAKTIKSLPLDIQEHQILRKGDILISLTGNVGRVSIVDEDNCLLNQRVGLLTFNDPTITEYVFQCLSSHKFELEMAKKGQGAAQLNIGNNDVTSYKIPISKNNTDSIAKVLRKIDEKIIIEEKLKKLLSEQKKYLLENLFI